EFRRDADSDSGFAVAAPAHRRRSIAIPMIAIVFIVIAAAAYFTWRARQTSLPPSETHAQITRLTSSGDVIAVAISPDGKRIAFIRNHYPTGSESAIIVANADGSDERMLLAKKAPESLAAGFFDCPSWSPDGRLIASDVRHNVSSWTPMAVDVQSGQETPLSNDRWAALGQIAWAPDGRRPLLTGATDSAARFGKAAPQPQVGC